MSPRPRKLLGTIVFAAGTSAYFLLAISIAIVRLPGTSLGAQLLFYLAITLVWLVWAGLLIRWMQKPASPNPLK